MNYLLDTVTFLWMFFGEDKNISRRVLALLENEDNKFYFSTVVAWEIAIKFSLGKLELKGEPSRLIPQAITKMGLIPLPISTAHGLAVASLPWYHRDPFDRMLIAQSKLEGFPILSPDSILKKYSRHVVW